MSETNSSRELFARDHFITDEDRNDGEAGVIIRDVSDALATLISMAGPISLGRASDLFHTTEAVIREAVEEGYWLFLSARDGDPSSDMIEIDGE